VEKTTYQMTIENGQVVTTQKTESIELSGPELNERRKTVLQSAVAYLTDLVFKDQVDAKRRLCPEINNNVPLSVINSWGSIERVGCLRCTYNAAWLIAQNPLLDSSDNPWVQALRSLPYNTDGRVDADGNPTKGDWYPWPEFVALFGNKFYDIKLNLNDLKSCGVI
jgi:hypothetical protein